MSTDAVQYTVVFVKSFNWLLKEMSMISRAEDDSSKLLQMSSRNRLQPAKKWSKWMMEPPSEEQVVKVEDERGSRRGIVKMDSLEVEGEVVYDREGVIVQAKREDRLHSGRLKVTDTRYKIQTH